MKWSFLVLVSIFFLFFFASCGDEPEAPGEENEEEIITDVILTFTPQSGGSTITASAQDPDGEGPEDLEILNNINLAASTSYILSIELTNSVAGEDITEEVMEESDEHQFFFSWSADVFSDPTGNGNVDNRNDPANYNDTDVNGLPVGLSTDWTTGGTFSGGFFRVVLKHQPGIKSPTSDFNSGETDVDLTWNLNIL